jgi:hypothetical protein
LPKAIEKAIRPQKRQKALEKILKGKVELLSLRREKLVGEGFMWKGRRMKRRNEETRDLSLLLKHSWLE